MESQRLKDLAEREINQIALNHGFKNPRLDFGNATEKATNFVSQVYRCIVVDLDNPDRRLDLIFKLPPAAEKRRKAIRVDGFFEVEVHMYSKVLPALSSCYAKRNLMPDDSPFPCTARTYSLVDEKEDKLVIMEDLKSKGFVMKDRLAGLDEIHCRLVLSKIARLHAASLALQREDPQLHNSLTDKFEENLFHREKMSDNFKRAIQNFRGFIDGRFPGGSAIRNKIESFLEDYQCNMKELVRKNSSLSCITHGDLWINNILFKYKEGSDAPEELCFIDFQISRMSSPVLDLAYFLTLCAIGETRNLYMDLVKYYHGSICAALCDLGHNPEQIVPWNLLQEQLQLYGRYGWTVAIVIMPLISLDQEDVQQLYRSELHPSLAHNCMEKKNSKDKIKQRFIEILEQADQLGFL